MSISLVSLHRPMEMAGSAKITSTSAFEWLLGTTLSKNDVYGDEDVVDNSAIQSNWADGNLVSSQFFSLILFIVVTTVAVSKHIVWEIQCGCERKH